MKIKSGFVLIDKPPNMTSHDVIAKLRRILGIKKIGHAGTLDPFATGILPIAILDATRLIEYISDKTKAYEFTIKFGIATDTDDITGKIINRSENIPKIYEIEAILPEFTGDIVQIPPKYSAISINGSRAYDMARKGVEFEIKPRKANISELRIVDYSEDILKLYADVSSGTYIRSLARDLGYKLGSFGTVTELKRVKFGKFNENNIKTLEKIQEMVHNGSADFLIESNDVLDDIPGIRVSIIEAKELSYGRAIYIEDHEFINGQVVKILLGDNIISIAEYNDNILAPAKFFNNIYLGD
jgi:tRNA pseudouridine55 synthase